MTNVPANPNPAPLNFIQTLDPKTKKLFEWLYEARRDLKNAEDLLTESYEFLAEKDELT